MSAMARRIVLFLLITLVINAGWTFNKEAVADLWFDEQRSLAVTIPHFSDEPGSFKNISPQSPCNHWCHAVGHFMGIFFLYQIPLTEIAYDYFIVRESRHPPAPSEGHYRPPRLSPRT